MSIDGVLLCIFSRFIMAVEAELIRQVREVL
jgi:hypothetical protein